MTEGEAAPYCAADDRIETAWIPLADGRRLAARLFLPKDAAANPVPVILEYIPYRRRDGTRTADDEMHVWFAANGYACARVDIAGSGDSDGLIEDEYVTREQDDGLEVIAWLAGQAWCSGAVGMIGISWGGFNGLQIAARRPPALKAVISLCSTVDRYHDDVHFMGGCVLDCNMDWGAYFFTMSGFPPDPGTAGEGRWRDLWRQRIENVELYPALWLGHRRRDAFWRHGSVIENYGAIPVPVLAVSGWADGYTRAVTALVASLDAPCKGIIGPWGHRYPHAGVPGPAIGFLQEARRWWDKWLKGIETGVDADPAMRLWLQEPQPPAGHVPERGGRWIGLDRWPVPQQTVQTLRLADGRLDLGAVKSTRRTATICSPHTTGLASGEWCAYGLGKIAPELPLDQRPDDLGSLTYDGAVLADALAVVGAPRVRLRVSCDKPLALLAVRLSVVQPDGSVERLSYGVLNLCHRDGHEQLSPLAPGVPYDVAVELKTMAHRIPAGQLLRLAVSTSYWPLLWPSPEPASVTVHEDGSWLELPVLDSVDDRPAPVFGPPESAPPAAVTVTREGAETRQILRDIGEASTTFRVSRDDGSYVIDDIGTEQTFTRVHECSIRDNDPLSARTRVACTASYRRGGWQARVESEIEMTCDDREFHFTARLATFDGERPFVERRIVCSVPRDHA